MKWRLLGLLAVLVPAGSVFAGVGAATAWTEGSVRLDVDCTPPQSVTFINDTPDDITVREINSAVRQGAGRPAIPTDDTVPGGGERITYGFGPNAPGKKLGDASLFDPAEPREAVDLRLTLHSARGPVPIAVTTLCAVRSSRTPFGFPPQPRGNVRPNLPPVQLRPRIGLAEGLVVEGSGFQPGERVIVTVGTPTGGQEFSTTADADGHFALQTGILGTPELHRVCGSIFVWAAGDRGTRQGIGVAWTDHGPPAERPPPCETKDFALPNGRFYTQTADQRGRGYSVTDDAEARFWAEFQRLGGVDGIGYPISRRFVWDGFTTQAFQKLVLQWRPEVGQVYAVNVLDQMHERGLDDWLQNWRATPPAADWSSDAGRDWPDVVAAHQALLTDPEIAASYDAIADPITVYGLPMAPIQDMGNVLVLRVQRAILQKWLVETPWAAAGQVTIANGGDVAREAGLIPAEAVRALRVEALAEGVTPPIPLQLTPVVTPQVTAGWPVELALRVTNPTSEIVTWSSGLPLVDFEVSRDGQPIWRFSRSRTHLEGSWPVELDPGETRIFREIWSLQDDPGRSVPAGEYQVVGVLTSSPTTRDPTEPVPLRSAPMTVTVR